jgi:hypothetical protein
MWTRGLPPEIGWARVTPRTAAKAIRTPVTREPGASSPTELIDRYADHSPSRSPTSASTKSSPSGEATVFMEGNYRRTIDGLTDAEPLASTP